MTMTASVYNNTDIIKENDIIYLLDKKTIDYNKGIFKDNKKVIDSLDKNGLKITIKSIKTITIKDILYKLVECLDGYKIGHFLLFKKAKDKYTVSLYFEIDCWEQGMTKAKAIKDGNYWLFKNPKDRTSKVQINNLIEQKIENTITQFKQKSASISGKIDKEECKITEWKTESNVEFTDLLLLEIGGTNNKGRKLKAGPNMFMYQGYLINETDIILN